MKKLSDGKIMLEKVRLSFPELFTPKSFGDDGANPKYSANFLMDKDEHKDEIAGVMGAIKEAIAGKWKTKPKDLKLCFSDGEEKSYDGYQNAWFLSANNKRRPVVIDKDKSPLVAEDEKIYAGCHVNAIVSFWCMDNKWGKRVLCNLEAVQFAGHGERFGGSSIDIETAFDDISEETAADVKDDIDDIFNDEEAA